MGQVKALAVGSVNFVKTDIRKPPTAKKMKKGTKNC